MKISHWDAQKYIYAKNDNNNVNVLCTESHKILCKHYVLEMAGSVFSVELYFFSTFIVIALHFRALC